MKKSIVSVFLLAITFGFFGKSKAQEKDSLYEARKLKIDEINFVSGYYTQEGNHSSIGGGKGDEALTNISNSIQVRLLKNSQKYEHRLDVAVAVDHHTSASTKLINNVPDGSPTNIYSGKISAKTAASSGTSGVTGASSKFVGWRIYPSINYFAKNLERNTTYGIGAYYSREFDYQSIGGELSFVKASQDNNSEFSVKAMAFFDQRLEILPVELRPVNTGVNNKKADDDEDEHEGNDDNYKLWNKNSYSVNFAYSQIINPRLQVSLLADFAFQDGLLSIPYNRVYFTNNTVSSEKLPMQRMKIPLGMRLNYFLGETFIFRTYYRYFFDDWGIKAHTAQLEIPIKISPFVSLSPFYRYHHQTSNDYFKPYGQHNPSEKYYSSDYDLSSFNSQNIGLNLHYLPLESKIFKSVDFRYSFYKRSEGLSAHNLTFAITFK